MPREGSPEPEFVKKFSTSLAKVVETIFVGGNNGPVLARTKGGGESLGRTPAAEGGPSPAASPGKERRGFHLFRAERSLRRLRPGHGSPSGVEGLKHYD